MATHVWMHNPETDGVWACPADVVDVMKGRGWEVTEAPDDSLDGLFDPAADDEPESTAFDPSEHTVQEVNDYLDQHRENAPGEVERVLELERAGKNRTTITGD